MRPAPGSQASRQPVTPVRHGRIILVMFGAGRPRDEAIAVVSFVCGIPKCAHGCTRKIEHRLFSHITMNWRGRPLTSHDVILNTIAATTTRTGLTVQAQLDTNTYPLGQRSAMPKSTRYP